MPPEGFTEGKTRYFAMVAPRHFGWLPGVCSYVACEPNQACPIFIEEQDVDPNQYQVLASRTECDQEAASRRRLFFDVETSNKLLATRLNHALIGMMGEVGEFAAAVEHWIQYGQDLDSTNVKEEIGDLLWYVALACNALGITMSSIMEQNIAKLKVRYPEKYTDELAAEKNRDREYERKVLELSPLHDDYPGQYGEEHRQQPTKVLGDLKPMHDSYDRYCTECHVQPIHKTNTLGLCSDCAAANRAAIRG